MKKINTFWIFLAIITVVMAVGFKLRRINFSSVPFPGESSDEYSNAWVGLSYIRLGVPVGISGLPDYPTIDFRYVNVDRIFQGRAMGNSFPISYPWFDHPPMMGLITGGYSYLEGARNFEDTTASTIRKPVLIMATITVGLTGLLAYLLFGWEAGVVTGLLMATSPLMIINSRMVQAENGFVPLFLLSMILLWLYKKHGGIKLLFSLSLTAGLAMLFKLSAAAIPLSVLIIILADRSKSSSTKLQESLILSTVTGSIFGLFLLFGIGLDLQTFMTVLMSNSGRVYGIGLSAISDLITNTKVTGTKYLSDGWPLVGWLGLSLMIGKKYWREKAKYVWIPILAYLAVYLFFGSQSYGWYRIPFLPFLMIVSAWMSTLFVKNIKLTIVSLLTLLIPLGINMDKYMEFNKLPWAASVWRIGSLALILGALSLVGVDAKNKNLRWLVYPVMIGLLALTIYTNLLRDGMFTVDYWYKVN